MPSDPALAAYTAALLPRIFEYGFVAGFLAAFVYEFGRETGKSFFGWCWVRVRRHTNSKQAGPDLGGA